jgi:hypothetical protein
LPKFFTLNKEQNMSQIQNITDTQKVPWLRVGVIGVGIVAMALMAPLVWMAATGGVGLLVLGAVLAVSYTALQAIPFAGQKLENKLLAARKAEARRNPIEQLQNEVLRRAQRLRAFRHALSNVGGQIESISQMLVERRHKDPTHELDRQERALRRLQQFQSANLARLGQAQSALEEFRFTVERKESEWRIAAAIGEANDLMDPNATDALMQDLLTDTALRSVQERFNQVFAELDVQMSSVDGPTRKLLDDQSLYQMDALHLPESNTQRSRA